MTWIPLLQEQAVSCHRTVSSEQPVLCFQSVESPLICQDAKPEFCFLLQPLPLGSMFLKLQGSIMRFD